MKVLSRYDHNLGIDVIRITGINSNACILASATDLSTVGSNVQVLEHCCDSIVDWGSNDRWFHEYGIKEMMKLANVEIVK